MKAIEEIINLYNPKTENETKAVLKEIVQSIILIGLSRSGFFSHASFYGGTALRIFYGLNRFSEDLDFTLNSTDSTFSINPYISKIKETSLSFGMKMEVTTKNKRVSTPIESAFAKVNTFQTFMDMKINKEQTTKLHRNENIKVKFEIDCNPALGFKTESKWIDLPEFAPVTVLDESSLFAGKLHAILCRNYRNNVKGRDYYDFLFFIQHRIRPNMTYLRNKLIASGKIQSSDVFNIEVLRDMLIDRFNSVDFDQVKRDAELFVFDNEDLSFYSKELYIQMTDRLMYSLKNKTSKEGQQ